MPVSSRDRGRPRLYRPAGDPEGLFPLPEDRPRQRILENILDDCRLYGRRRPWARIPERLDSPHPYHQLYITFYTAMQASALIEQYAFAWRMTGNPAWLRRARAWLLAAAGWEHSDRIEEHFYSANRYMHAFAVGLDFLGDRLSLREEQRVTDCLLRLMERWWPDVESQRHSPEGGHHAVVDNAHFGVAALHLLDSCSEASGWVEAVVDRFRGAIMTNGSGPRGEPVDGASFWPWENLWMLQFADALRNVAGIDLFAEFPGRLSRPLEWFRYQLAGAGAQGAGRRAAWSPTLLRLAQEAGDAPLREAALGDPDLGRVYRFMAGVRGSTAECVLASGPSAYMYCDPGFRERRRRRPDPPGRRFRARYGDAAVMRDRWDEEALVVQVCGYGGGTAHNYSELHLHLAGEPVLKTIPAAEAQPVACGSLPCVGGQNEMVAHLGQLRREEAGCCLRVKSRRLHQEYRLLPGPPPVLLAAVKRRPRGVSLVQRGGESFARLDGRDCLQYAREPHFNPGAGRLRMQVRLHRTQGAGDGPRVLFNTGLGTGAAGGPGPRVNSFTLGLDGDGLFFRVQSQRGRSVEARIPPEAGELKPGEWCEVGAAWGGFNRRGGRPFVAVDLGGVVRRCDDPEQFGELGVDSQGLRSRSAPRDFYISSNTVLALAGAVQLEGTETSCDLRLVELRCPGRTPLRLDFAEGLGEESGSAPPLWKLNPAELRRSTRRGARLGAGQQAVDLVPVFPGRVHCAREVVPYAPPGLAAGSLRRLGEGDEEDSPRILVAAEEGDFLVLALAPARARLRVDRDAGGFALKWGPGRCQRFSLSPAGGKVLQPGESGDSPSARVRRTT